MRLSADAGPDRRSGRPDAGARQPNAPRTSTRPASGDRQPPAVRSRFRCARAGRRLRRAISAWRRSRTARSEEHTSELQSLMRISYAVFCLKKKKTTHHNTNYSNLINEQQYASNNTNISHRNTITHTVIAEN